MVELSEGGFEMLIAAVNTAREHRCRDLATLRERLRLRWPGREDDQEQAIAYWAANVRERYPHGVPND